MIKHILTSKYILLYFIGTTLIILFFCKLLFLGTDPNNISIGGFIFSSLWAIINATVCLIYCIFGRHRLLSCLLLLMIPCLWLISLYFIQVTHAGRISIQNNEIDILIYSLLGLLVLSGLYVKKLKKEDV